MTCRGTSIRKPGWEARAALLFVSFVTSEDLRRRFPGTQGLRPDGGVVWVVMHPWVRRNPGPRTVSRVRSVGQRTGCSHGGRVGLAGAYAPELVHAADPPREQAVSGQGKPRRRTEAS